MIRNYFKIAWRNLLKNKGFSIINITGLGIGIAACLLISLFILHEKSYDKHIPNAENIYRLIQYFNIEGKDEWGASHSANMASTIEREFDEVEKAGRILDNPQRYGAGSNEIKIEGQSRQFHEEGFAYADQSTLDIFHVPFVYGDASTALNKPFTVVFSESKAKKYFGNENPVGKTIYINGNNDQAFTISGVMGDFKENSNFNYDFFITLKEAVFFDEGEETRWTQRNFFNYLQIKPGTDIARFEKRLTNVMYTNHILPAYRNAGRIGNAETLEKFSSLELQALPDIHLYSDEIADGHTRGDIRFIWIFGAIALFILIIACINFINLSTAQSANRAKEVGLKKVMGSMRKNLIIQFLTESVIITMIAFGFGLLLSWISLPLFNSIINKKLTFPWASLEFISIMLVASIIIGVIAGMYPSFYLSGFNPVNVLKGKVSQGSKSGRLRGGLVIFQFTISIILIVGTLVVQQQMNFILNKKLGFNKDQLIQIHGVNAVGEQLAAFKSELKNIKGVNNVSLSAYLPIKGTMRNSNNFRRIDRDERERFQAQNWGVDEDYIETLGMKLVGGRNFDPARPADNEAIIINQTMAKALNLANPIGQQIIRSEQRVNIIGVVEDFNFQSLKDEITPLTLRYNNFSAMASVKVKTSEMPALLNSLENKWKIFAPDIDFRYTFMDASYAKMYENVQRMGKIFSGFAILAILVACLGLLALSAYMVEQRKKEMSIRKVLGASAQIIFKLLTRYFLTLVCISMLIAVPVAVYLMQKWLEDYAYRTSISWQVFAIAGISTLLIALATVSYLAIKTAVSNPIKSLRTE